MWLIGEGSFEGLKQYFPKSRGKPLVDDWRVVSGIVYVLRNWLRWKDIPKEYGPYKTLYNRFVRWSRMGIFAKILQKLAELKTEILMIDATHLKVHRTAASPKKGICAMARRATARNLRWLGRPLRLLLTAGNVNGIIGAGELLKDLPDANYLLADRGYDAKWLREELKQRGVEPCIPHISTRKIQQPYDTNLYKQRHKIENMFSRLKDWRRVATHYDRCPLAFSLVAPIACSFIFYLAL